MPAMKHRHGDDAPQQPKIPIYISVEEDCVEREDGSTAKRDCRIVAKEQDRRDLRHLVHEFIDGINT